VVAMGSDAECRLLYRGLCQEAHGIIYRGRGVDWAWEDRRRTHVQVQVLLPGMRSCHTGLALLFGVGALAAP